MSKKSEKSESLLENGGIVQTEIEEVVSIALSTLKTLMADYETPIDIRLRVALEIFELFSTNNTNTNPVPHDEGVLRCLEKNARDIEKNAHQLSYIETLLKMAAEQKNHETVLQNSGRVINH
jgi:hypothetical protein